MLKLPSHIKNHPHPRLLAAVLLGLACAALIPGEWHTVTRFLLGWNVMVWSYLLLMAWLMLRADPAQVIRIANQEDEHGAAILALFSLATLASIVAIVLELSAQVADSLRMFRYTLTAATVLGAWLFVGVLFTFHYSRMFYSAPEQQRPLQFPGGETTPNYWDFLYFAFTIAVAAQTADVATLTRAMRKTVLAQALLSFLFNMTIIGLSINVIASLIH